MTHLRWALFLAMLAAFPLAAAAQGMKLRDAIVIYKDGFHIKGKVREQVRDVIYDSASGRSFSIPSGDFYVDDQWRTIRFSPTHVQKVIQFKPGEIKEPMRIVRFKSVYQPRAIHATWQYESVSKWNTKGERTIGVRTGKGTFDMTQKIAVMTPRYMLAVTMDYQWDLRYAPQEFGPELIRPILLQIFSEDPILKKLKDADKYLQVAAFMHEAGWLEDAEKELAGIIVAFPKEKKLAEQMLAKVKKDRAELFVESIEQAANIGQHQVALDRLAAYDRSKDEDIVDPKLRLAMLDLKAKYKKSTTDMDYARACLRQMPDSTANTAVWAKAGKSIADQLNHDTISRLDTFLLFARQLQMDLNEKRKPNQTVEQVLALAVSGWLQGNQAAEPDVKAALKLSHSHAFLLDYLQKADDQDRATLLNNFKRGNDLPIDVLTKLIRMMPPSHAYDDKDINTDVQTVTIEAPDNNGGAYLLQLPPDYHHLRSYPVLMLLHGGRDKADDMLKRFSAEAAKHGFILAAPLWAGKNIIRARAPIGGAKEHALVLDTLRDLRRRFNVDSDRAFLFGWEDGANLAFDIGLGHPDCFAGVAPMCGNLTPSARRYYWTNAQYLPFYVVDGERNGGNAKAMKDLFKKEWTHEPFASIYVEYQGRSSEWFGQEIPNIVNWMSRKKRHTPMKEMGVAGIGNSPGVEFRSTRSLDNRFYWLSSQTILDRCLIDHTAKQLPSFKFQPATFQANLKVGNKSTKDGAKIWNQANIRVTGASKVTLWITPSMMDLTKPLAIVYNGQQVGGMRAVEPSLATMLEELYRSGDRQRLFVAKVDF